MLARVVFITKRRSKVAIAEPRYYDYNDQYMDIHEKTHIIRELETTLNEVRAHIRKLSDELHEYKRIEFSINNELRYPVNTRSIGIIRSTEDYMYKNVRLEGPTRHDLRVNPSLRDAWETYEIVRRISQ